MRPLTDADATEPTRRNLTDWDATEDATDVTDARVYATNATN